MPQNAFFPWTHDLLASQKTRQRHFFSTLHPFSLVIFATATILAFVLLRNSRFHFHCYTQHEAMPTQKSAQKWCRDLLQLLAQKITKGSCKPASLNRPTVWGILWYWYSACNSCVTNSNRFLERFFVNWMMLHIKNKMQPPNPDIIYIYNN